jgi:DNA-binding transcriptional LysR family regulator
MEIRELRAFVAVVDAGGFSSAARQLHVSQSALSQTVRSLERALGVQLLLRSRTGVRTTEAGERLLDHARAMLELHDSAIEDVTGNRGVEQALRVGVPLEFPLPVLTAAVRHLGEHHPSTRVELRTGSSADQLIALRARELDLALLRDRPSDTDLDAVLAVEETPGVVLSAGQAADIAGPDGVLLDKLAGLTWSGFPRDDTPAWYDQVSATMRAHGIRVLDQSDHDVPTSLEAKYGAVATGRVFALAPPERADQLPAEVVWRPLAGRPLVRRTWAVWPSEQRRRDLATLVRSLDLRAKIGDT